MFDYFVLLSVSDKISFISLIVAILSALLSLTNFVILLIARHKKLEINLISYRIVKLKNFYFHQFQVQILNKSQLPISIKSISCNNIYSPRVPYLVKEESFKNSSGNKEYLKTMTFSFPINLSSFEGVSGYLEFKSKDKIDLNSLKFDVFSNRGKLHNIEVDTRDAIKDTAYNPYSV